MAQAFDVENKNPVSDLDLDPDFEPQKRPRSCTWPLPRPDSNAAKPEPTESEIIPEEDDDDDQNCPDDPNPVAQTGQETTYIRDKPIRKYHAHDPALYSVSNGKDDKDSNSSRSSKLSSAASDSSFTTLAPAQPRKSSARRNAWGNYSYADLITQAIESSPEKRLTLAQIYDWMVRSVPYFKDKGDNNSSAGWKVSV